MLQKSLQGKGAAPALAARKPPRRAAKPAAKSKATARGA
jgi:hypothetical protein